MHAKHHVFEHLIAKCQALEPIPTAVVYPLSDVALAGGLLLGVGALGTRLLAGFQTAQVDTQNINDQRHPF